MTEEELLDLLCYAKTQLVDIYKERFKELVEKDAPEAVFLMMEKERDEVMVGLSSRIEAISTKLYG
jgi:hypothetical protein